MTEIKDPLMEPYHLVKDDYCYTIVETQISDGKHHFSKGVPKSSEKKLSYFSSFANAIEEIAELKALKKKNKYESLREYITEWRNIKTELKTLIETSIL